jgi:hypothetical protein
MRINDDYVSLVSCLPSSERLFVAKLPPISRLKLNNRLKQMTPSDQDTLQKVESVLDWGMQNLALSNRELVKHANNVLASIKSETLRALVRDKMELRTCVTALRKKAKGDPAPTDNSWGFGRWVAHINRHWNDPHFALEKVFNWLPEAQLLIDRKDAEAMERFILERAFKQLQRYSTQHHFDLEAVIIYVLKWNIIERGSHYNTEAARQRFNDLVDEGLGNFSEPLFKDRV